MTDNSKSCKMIPNTDSIVGEDIVMLTDNLLLASSDDRRKLWLYRDDGSSPEMGGPANTEDGALFLVDISDSTVEPKKVKILNFPRQLAFHPHGLALFKTEEKTTIFVINHAYERGGERIEVLTYEDDGQIYYKNSFTNNKFFNKESMGNLNALVAFDEREIYVTEI